MSITPLPALAAIALLASGCATVRHGGHQQIYVSSVPEGAQVLVNGAPQARTPTRLDLVRRRSGQVVRIEMQGFEPVEIRLYPDFPKDVSSLYTDLYGVN